MVPWRDDGIVRDSDEEAELSLDEDEYQAATEEPRAATINPVNQDLNERSGFSPSSHSTRTQSLPPSVTSDHDPLVAEQSSGQPSSRSRRHTRGLIPAQDPEDDESDLDELQSDYFSPSVRKRLGIKPRLSDDKSSLGSPLTSSLPDVFDMPKSSSGTRPGTPPTTDNLEPQELSSLRFEPIVLINQSTDRSESAFNFSNLEEISEGENLTAARRNFRARKAIQVHPYALENEKYRRSLRARGYRPIIMAPDGTRQALESEETQDYELSSSQLQHSAGSPETRPDSSPNSFHRPSGPPGIQNNLEAVDKSGSEDLPDIDTLLRRPPYYGIRNRFKRRKVAHSDQDASPVPGNVSQVAVESGSNDTNVPARKPKRKYRKKFKVPYGYDDTQLPSPKPSSERKEGRHSNMQRSDYERTEADCVASRGSSSSPIRPSNPRHRPVAVALSPLSTSSESEQGKPDHVRRYQRKIRGVLPASWLRLDRYTSAPKQKQAQPLIIDPSPSKPSPQKGVARRLVQRQSLKPRRSEAHEPRAAQAVVISDDSQSDDDVSTLSPDPDDPQISSAPQAMERDCGLIDDMQEDDWVDPMVPNSSCQAPNRSIKRKKQMRMTDHFHRSKRRAVDVGGTDQPRRDAHGSRPRQHRKQWVRRRQAPRLSIIDAPQPPGKSCKPKFVRIAERTALSRTDLGRHSPNSKLISLQTRDDGESVDQTLRDWRRNQISINRGHKPRGPNTLQFQRATRIAKTPLLNSVDRTQARLPLPIAFDCPRRKVLGVVSEKRTNGQIPIRQPRLRVQSLPHIVAEDTQGKENLNMAKPPSLDESLNQTNSSDFLGRQGQLEELEATDDAEHPNHAFMKHLRSLNQRRGINHQMHAHDDPLTRYLEGDVTETNQEGQNSTRTHNGDPPTAQNRLDGSKPVRKRKQRPLRLDVDLVQIHQATHDADEPDHFSSVQCISRSDLQESAIDGLAQFGTIFTTNFDIHPLPFGVFFRENTFIGSGDFREALRLHVRNFTDRSANAKITIGGRKYWFGGWNEETSAGLAEIFAKCVESLENCNHSVESFDKQTCAPIKVLRQVVKCISQSLFFLDAIDRSSCVETSLKAICRFKNNLEHIYDQGGHGTQAQEKSGEALTRAVIYTLVISLQVFQLSNHHLVNDCLQQEARIVCISIIHFLFRLIACLQMSEVKEFLDPARIKYVRETGIRDTEYSIEALVVVLHAVHVCRAHEGSYLDLLKDHLLSQVPDQCRNVQQLEDAWHSLFAFLPFQEIDSEGMLENGSRFSSAKDSSDRWVLVKELLSRSFSIYATNPNLPAINSYLRCLLSRCFELIRVWGWQKCDIMLGIVFDFFARNGLSHLANEENHGSSAFLERLDLERVPHPLPTDRSFSLFLKLLANGLTHMGERYPGKKLKNIIWRFIPNHGRVHSKEDELRHDELHALRNHHDLLCTLYYASPSSMRSKLLLVRRLIDLKSSHAEVCHLNVRAWANLCRFQVSTDEPIAMLDPFASWFQDIIRCSLELHTQARTEGEAAFVQSNLLLSREKLEATVKGNQRQIEGVLGHALGSMRGILHDAKNYVAAARLFEKSSVLKALLQCDLKQSRLLGIMSTTLDCSKQYFDIAEKHFSKLASPPDEESQDYGEFPLDEGEESHSTFTDIESVSDQVKQCLCSVFGSDASFEETYLVKLVETYTDSAYNIVRLGRRDWAYYVDPHASGSWDRLRDSPRKRRLLPLYVANIINKDPTAIDGSFETIFAAWMICLVERESQLKYQHLFTTSLLNACPQHPLLQNLPFSRKARDDKYAITSDDLRQRRLSLISTLLSNMRANLENEFLASTIKDSNTYNNVRQCYIYTVRQSMEAMKRNHREAEQTTTNRGTYVDFVHSVVQFLQQYAADICAVDRYFIESATFPLPAGDPMYIIGRLRSYEYRSGDERNQKKLAVFIMTASERAVQEGQGDYLRDQLIKSVEGTSEQSPTDSAARAPSLRQILLKTVFPPYVDAARHTEAGYILCAPVLQAASAILEDIPYCIDLNETSSLIHAAEMTTPLLMAAHRALANSTPSSGTFAPRLILNLIPASLPTLDFALRSLQLCSQGGPHKVSTTVQRIIDQLTSLYHLLAALKLGFGTDPSLRNTSNTASVAHTANAVPDSHPPVSRNEVHAFTARELHGTLEKNWRVERHACASNGGVARVKRGGGVVEVAVGKLGTQSEESELVTGLLDHSSGIIRGIEGLSLEYEEDGDQIGWRDRARIGADVLA